MMVPVAGRCCPLAQGPVFFGQIAFTPPLTLTHTHRTMAPAGILALLACTWCAGLASAGSAAVNEGRRKLPPALAPGPGPAAPVGGRPGGGRIPANQRCSQPVPPPGVKPGSCFQVCERRVAYRHEYDHVFDSVVYRIVQRP
jgi:hypothetical protein